MSEIDHSESLSHLSALEGSAGWKLFVAKFDGEVAAITEKILSPKTAAPVGLRSVMRVYFCSEIRRKKF
ncbi:MAG: hypothetical protein Q8M02_14630 [Candidatus Didemnitutus sp.]|nr:hypothetical protein [Candidatus Didemnitutus sp.]